MQQQVREVILLIPFRIANRILTHPSCPPAPVSVLDAILLQEHETHSVVPRGSMKIGKLCMYVLHGVQLRRVNTVAK